MPLIHHISLGNKIPKFNQECLDSWGKLKDRNFDVVSWTDQRAKDYLARCDIAEAKRLFARARNYGEASDILRMAITYSYGGLYVDWDVLLVDPDKFLAVMPDFESSSCILIRDPLTKEPSFSCAYDNSLFYMKKGNPLALDFLREMENSYSRDPVPNTPYVTGPLALTSFLDSHPHYKNDCGMVDTVDVYAFDYEDVIAQTTDHTQRAVLKDYYKPGGAPAIHFWTHTWPPELKWSRRVRLKALRILRMGTGFRKH
jgi:hypothetical protein